MQPPALIEKTAITDPLTQCSPGLWKLLTEGDNAKGAARLIAINPTLRAECARAYDALVEATRPVDEAVLLAKLVEIAPQFYIREQEPEAWRTFFAVYLRELSDLPLGAVHGAISAWIRGELYPNDIGRHRSYPKVAELRVLAKPILESLIKARGRAKVALDHVEKAPPKPLSDEARAEDRRRAIEMGIIDERGRVVLPEPKGGPPPVRPAGRLTQAEAANRLRAIAQEYDGGEVI